VKVEGYVYRASEEMIPKQLGNYVELKSELVEAVVEGEEDSERKMQLE
jgi:hypothetical protein